MINKKNYNLIKNKVDKKYKCKLLFLFLFNKKAYCNNTYLNIKIKSLNFFYKYKFLIFIFLLLIKGKFNYKSLISYKSLTIKNSILSKNCKFLTITAPKIVINNNLNRLLKNKKCLYYFNIFIFNNYNAFKKLSSLKIKNFSINLFSNKNLLQFKNVKNTFFFLSKLNYLLLIKPIIINNVNTITNIAVNSNSININKKKIKKFKFKFLNPTVYFKINYILNIFCCKLFFSYNFCFYYNVRFNVKKTVDFKLNLIFFLNYLLFINDKNTINGLKHSYNFLSNNFLKNFFNFFENDYIIDFGDKNNKRLFSYNNYYPVSLTNKVTYNKFFSNFKNNYEIEFVSFTNKLVIPFLEKNFKKNIFIKYSNNYFNNFDSYYLDFIINDYKKFQPAYWKNFLVYDFIKILWYSFFLKDLTMLSEWISVFMEKLHFKNHKKFLSFFSNFINKYSDIFVNVLKLKGFFFDIRGKVGVTGSSKKRHFFFKFGSTNKSSKKTKIGLNQSLVRTYSGVLGLTYIINY